MQQSNLARAETSAQGPRFGTLGLKLHEAGWDVIPVKARSKSPNIKGWQRGFTRAQMCALADDRADGSIGLVAKKFPGIDVDVPDQQCADAIERCAKEILGPAPVRYGSRPKRLLMYGTNEPTTKRIVYLLDPQGRATYTVRQADCKNKEKPLAVEVLGDGQQYVIYGEHPDGFEYTWPNDDGPADSEIWELTQVSSIDLDRFAAALPRFLPPGWRVGQGPVAQDGSPSHDGLDGMLAQYKLPLDGWPLERVKKYLLPSLNPDIGHDEWVKVGMALHHQGQGDDDWLQAWDRWSAGSGKYADGETEKRWSSFRNQRYRGAGAVTLASLIATSKKSQKAGEAPARPRRGFNLVQARELLVKPQQATPLIHGFIEHGALGALLGAPGACKSFLALGMSACVATGTPFHGRGVKQGTVIYVAGEGHAGLGRRLKAWEIASGISLQDASLFITTMPVSLMDDESMVLVAQKVDEVAEQHGPPALLIVDTLHRNAAGLEENSARDMGVVLGHIDELRERYGCAVVLVHHVGHGASDRARGSSSFRAALDFEYLMTVEGPHLRLTSTKSKEAEMPEPVTFAKVKVLLPWTDQNEDLLDSLVLQEVAAASKHRKHPKGTKGIALAALREAMAAITPDDLLGENILQGVPARLWRDAAYRAGISDSDEPDTRAKAFRRARGELLGQGYVSCVNELYRPAE